MEAKEILGKLIREADSLKGKFHDDPQFKIWKATVERRLVQLYGENSKELDGFKEIQFYWILGRIKEREIHGEQLIKNAENGLYEATLFLNSLIEDIEVFPDRKLSSEPETPERIFLSHTKADFLIVKEIVRLLEVLGFDEKTIFCSSYDGYGIPLGENWLEYLKQELSGKVVVISLITSNYYNSVVSICEMGAAWALSKTHIPILVPPINFPDLANGVIPHNQGFKINDESKLNLFKERLETLFKKVPKKSSIWEPRKKEILENILKQINP